MTRTSSMKLSVLLVALAMAGAAACDDDEVVDSKTASGGAAGSSAGGGTGGAGAAGSGGTSASGGTSGSGGSSGTGAVAGGGAGGVAGTDAGADASDGDAPNNVAYPGAPPTMLHNPYGCTNNCLTCHEQGGSGAPKTPHPERLLCRQCHLPQANVPLFVDNTFGK